MFDPSPSSRRSKGFTLLELMIVVAVIGIIAAVAIPSYRSNVRSAQRANAAAVLVDCAQKLERYYSQGMTYVGATVGASGTCVLPPGVANHYTIAIDAPTPTPPAVSTYTLVATPTSAQSADSCKALCVDSAGAKLAGNATGSGSTCAARIPTPVSSGCW